MAHISNSIVRFIGYSNIAKEITWFLSTEYKKGGVKCTILKIMGQK